jgi:DNA-binding winged helix-turn-helix (wHTH) protein
MTVKGAENRKEIAGSRRSSPPGEVLDPPEAEGSAPIAFRFADFELRLGSGELWKAGEPVKLQPRPARVLEVLVRAAGEVVSRDEIRRAVWGEETYVDLDLALNFCIRQIRGALGDSAEAPRFVVTLPRRGYRFLARVEAVHRGPPPSTPAPSPQVRRLPALAAALALLILAVGLVALRSRMPRPPAASGDASLATMPPTALGRVLAPCW